MTNKISLKRFFLFALILVTVISIIPVTKALAANDENYNGGQTYAIDGNLSVYDSASFSNKIGTIYQYEGYTVLYTYNDYYYVEYSTSSGAKRGYVKHETGELILQVPKTCVAKVLTNSTLYCGPSSTVNTIAGTVYAGELVTIIAKNDDWVYVEYNTTSGRKRGHMLYANLYCYNRPSSFRDLFSYKRAGKDYWVTGYKAVYAGPSTQYPIIGSVQDENVTVLGSDDIGAGNYDYIEYNTSATANGGTRKAGFILN